MPFFKLFGRVIEEEFEPGVRLPDKRVKKALTYITKKYKRNRIAIEADGVNYDDPGRRCAYVYKYSASHAFIMNMIMHEVYNSNLTEMQRLCNQSCARQKLNICSVGGGPGSDLVGVWAFFVQEFKHRFAQPAFDCTIIDGYIGWKSVSMASIQHFCDIFGVSPEMVTSRFVKTDLLEESSFFSIENCIKEAHIITVVKFMSAICSDAQRAASLMMQIFSHLQPGAWVVFMDNASGDSFRQMCSHAEAAGLEAIYGPYSNEWFRIRWSHEKNVWDFLKRFNKVNPPSHTNVCFAIWKKPVSAAFTHGRKRRLEYEPACSAPAPKRQLIYDRRFESTDNVTSYNLGDAGNVPNQWQFNYAFSQAGTSNNSMYMNAQLHHSHDSECYSVGYNNYDYNCQHTDHYRYHNDAYYREGASWIRGNLIRSYSFR